MARFFSAPGVMVSSIWRNLRVMYCVDAVQIISSVNSVLDFKNPLGQGDPGLPWA